jgi:hypothetical protein
LPVHDEGGARQSPAGSVSDASGDLVPEEADDSPATAKAVEASPKLWIRSASRATELERTKTAS